MYSVIYEISMYVHRQTLSLILFYSIQIQNDNNST